MVERPGPLLLGRQCQLLGLNRAALYYQAAPVDAYELELMYIAAAGMRTFALPPRRPHRTTPHSPPHHEFFRASGIYYVVLGNRPDAKSWETSRPATLLVPAGYSSAGCSQQSPPPLRRPLQLAKPKIPRATDNPFREPQHRKTIGPALSY